MDEETGKMISEEKKKNFSLKNHNFELEQHNQNVITAQNLEFMACAEQEQLHSVALDGILHTYRYKETHT